MWTLRQSSRRGLWTAATMCTVTMSTSAAVPTEQAPAARITRATHNTPTPPHPTSQPPTSRHPDPEAATTTVLIQDKTFPFPAIAPRTCLVLVTRPPSVCLFIIDRTFIHKGRRPERSPFRRAARAEGCRSGDVAAAKLSVEWRCAEPRRGQLASCLIACFEQKKTKVG